MSNARGGNMVKETTNTAGTSVAFSLLGAPAGFRTVAEEFSNGDTLYYFRGDSSGIWEAGIGTYNSGTNKITPTTGLDSSSSTPGGAFVPIAWGAGTQNVTCCPAAQAFLYVHNNLADVANPATSRTNLSAELAFATGNVTKWAFAMPAAPTGWTIDTTFHDKVLLAVNDGTGGGTSGSWTITGLAVGGHTLTVAEMPNHTHDLFQLKQSYGSTAPSSPVGVVLDVYATDPGGIIRTVVNVGTKGGDGSHTHPLTADGTWRPAAAKVTVCKKT